MAEMLVLLSHQLSKISKNKMGHPVHTKLFYHISDQSILDRHQHTKHIGRIGCKNHSDSLDCFAKCKNYFGHYYLVLSPFGCYH